MCSQRLRRYLARSQPVSVDHQVRAARITDIDRLAALCAEAMSKAAGDGPLVAPDLLRQLVYIPQASVLVAEVRRSVIGVAILALRPSVRAGGFVGTVDLLVVDPRHDVDAVADTLIEEVLRSARNKGCVTVEVTRPEDPAEQARWSRRGFSDAGTLLARPVATGRVASRTS
jgi:N-acetylglutamate synthase-like GNAT family acetyltransferase